MTEKEMERSIRQAFEHATPDVLGSVLDACDKQKGTVIMMKENKRKYNWIPKVVGIAAALALVLGAGFGWNTYQANYAVVSTVSLDVNPSIEITVNQKERVLDVTALNEDGKKILDDMDFKGSDIDVTVNAIIGSMLRHGYISELSNSILVSVDSKDSASAAALQEKLANEVNALLQTETFSGAVISQTVSRDDELETLASQHNISVGKAKLIQRIITQNTRYAFEDLVGLSINELNLLTESGNLHLDTVTSTGTASDKRYIGIDAAKQAALTHAVVAETDIYGFEIDMDLENGVMVYEIEFETTEYEYEYDINALDGSVVWQEKEVKRDDDGKPAVTPTPGTPDVPDITTLIGKDAAKVAAINHAGVTADSLSAFECELDRDHGTYIYEIEFKSGGYEYDYDINAETGTVMKFQKELDDDRDDDAPVSDSNSYISKDAAKATALTHAGVTADAIRDYGCELDTDNGKARYEIEFESAGVDYEYEIDANTGAVLKSEKEQDD